jgi:four helix bundle protein
VSIASNVAEGAGRRSKGEFLHFRGIGRGSNYEVQTQLVIARELGFGASDARLRCEQSDEVARMLNAFMTSISKT